MFYNSKRNELVHVNFQYSTNAQKYVRSFLPNVTNVFQNFESDRIELIWPAREARKQHSSSDLKPYREEKWTL